MSLPVIALGPRGGKIVGYDAMHNPIYQGSAAAKQLAAEKGINDDGEFGLSELLDQLHSSLGVTATQQGGAWILSLKVAADKVSAKTAAKVEAVLRSRL